MYGEGVPLADWGAPWPRLVHTYSIVARDPKTGLMGLAVQSHYYSVGRTVPWVEAGVGVVATQCWTLGSGDVVGPQLITLMRQGVSAGEAIATVLRDDPGRDFRQVAIVDAKGNVAAHTGPKATAAAGHLTGDNFSVQANIMLNESVWPAMKKAYEAAQGDLAERMLAALEGAQAAGGDIRGQQSAAMVIVSGEKMGLPTPRLVDLHVEDHPEPVRELRRLVHLQRAMSLLDRGRLSATAGKFDEAVADLTKALALEPNQIEIEFYLAVALLGAGQESKALQVFRAVFAKEPIWADVVPRVAPRWLARIDPALLKRVAALRR